MFFSIQNADLDESLVKESHPEIKAEELSLLLAQGKAALISQKKKESLVIGADQILQCEGKIFSKAKNKKEAKTHLQFLRGKEHRLVSAASIWKNGQEIWNGCQEATLTMRPFSDSFLDHYLEEKGDEILSSVGCYQLEKGGIQLFSTIKGDYFTILGLPLLPILAFMRRYGVLEE